MYHVSEASRLTETREVDLSGSWAFRHVSDVAGEIRAIPQTVACLADPYEGYKVPPERSTRL